MARINVEDSIWLSPRFKYLSKKLGCEFKAIGVLVYFWRLSQEQFKNGKYITEEQFKLSYLPDELFEAGLAIRSPEGIRARGEEENHGWLLGRIAAGRMGGLKTQSKKREHNEINNIGKANDKQTQASYSSSSSKKLLTTTTILKGEVVKQPSPQVSGFIKVFVESYKKRYGAKARPDLSGKVQGQIKTLLTTVGYERSCDLIQIFLQMQDKWFITKAHDFSTFINNIQKISLALDTGSENKSGINWDYIFEGTPND